MFRWQRFTICAAKAYAILALLTLFWKACMFYAVSPINFFGGVFLASIAPSRAS